MNEPGLFHIFLTGLLKTREVIASPSPTTLTCKRCTGGAGTEEPPRVCRGQVRQDDTWMGHKMGLPKLPLQKFKTGLPNSTQIIPNQSWRMTIMLGIAVAKRRTLWHCRDIGGIGISRGPEGSSMVQLCLGMGWRMVMDGDGDRWERAPLETHHAYLLTRRKPSSILLMCRAIFTDSGMFIYPQWGTASPKQAKLNAGHATATKHIVKRICIGHPEVYIFIDIIDYIPWIFIHSGSGKKPAGLQLTPTWSRNHRAPLRPQSAGSLLRHLQSKSIQNVLHQHHPTMFVSFSF